jgi:hypothetical protein
MARVRGACVRRERARGGTGGGKRERDRGEEKGGDRHGATDDAVKHGTSIVAKWPGTMWVPSIGAARTRNTDEVFTN